MTGSKRLQAIYDKGFTAGLCGLDPWHDNPFNSEQYSECKAWADGCKAGLDYNTDTELDDAELELVTGGKTALGVVGVTLTGISIWQRARERRHAN